MPIQLTRFGGSRDMENLRGEFDQLSVTSRPSRAFSRLDTALSVSSRVVPVNVTANAPDPDEHAAWEVFRIVSATS